MEGLLSWNFDVIDVIRYEIFIDGCLVCFDIFLMGIWRFV